MDNRKIILEMLEKRFNSFYLTKKQLAEVMSCSLSTIDNLLKNEINIPRHVKFGKGNKSSIRFTIVDIADFLTHDDGGVI